MTQWSALLLADHLLKLEEPIIVSARSISRILKAAPLQPHRQKMWLTSHDDEFRAKRDDVLRLYDEAPSAEHIICLDEKTGMQALERRYPDIPMQPGQPAKREFEYIRHGTLCLMGAYDVRGRKLFGFASEDHDSLTFVDLLEAVDTCYPDGKGHLVMDNLSMHNTDDVHDWLEEHPRWTLHFTPKHASWLNQIECAFSLLARHVLARGSFRSLEELCQRVYEYMLWFNAQEAPPFHWTYRPRSWSQAPGGTSGERH